MHSWTTPSSIVRRHKIRSWKKHHLHQRGKNIVLSPLEAKRDPVFKNQGSQAEQAQEVIDFLSRFRQKKT